MILFWWFSKHSDEGLQTRGMKEDHSSGILPTDYKKLFKWFFWDDDEEVKEEPAAPHLTGFPPTVQSASVCPEVHIAQQRR